MFEEIKVGSRTYAMIIRAGYVADGIKFFTPREFSQQLAYMNRPAGHVIEPHVHNEAVREVALTKEVIFIRSGRVRIDFYGTDYGYLQSRILEAGDIALLAYGGHGFEMIEASEIVEVKQGPYAGDADKTRFSPVAPDQLRWAS
jgi:hypothetical protein